MMTYRALQGTSARKLFMWIAIEVPVVVGGLTGGFYLILNSIAPFK
jgi:hypothetical protein